MKIDAAKYGEGEIDIVSATKAYESKSNINGKSYTKIYSQLERLVLWSKDNSKAPVVALPNAIGDVKKTVSTAIENLQKKYGINIEILRYDDI